ncbi:hypothetical protein CPB85DRAFT_133244 [Mucidula mucida]|nr:hypothetical protein CPB85DRAFT_133244 [Mucidula mucida]
MSRGSLTMPPLPIALAYIPTARCSVSAYSEHLRHSHIDLLVVSIGVIFFQDLSASNSSTHTTSLQSGLAAIIKCSGRKTHQFLLHLPRRYCPRPSRIWLPKSGSCNAYSEVSISLSYGDAHA